MESLVVVVLYIGETLISCVWVFRVVHAQDVHDHPVEDLCLAINLGVEGRGLSDLGI